MNTTRVIIIREYCYKCPFYDSCFIFCRASGNDLSACNGLIPEDCPLEDYKETDKDGTKTDK